MFNDFVVFVFKLWMCGRKDNFLSNVTPRNLCCGRTTSSCPFIFRDGSGSIPLTVENGTHTVFSGEKRNPFTLAHFVSLLIVSCTCLSHEARLDEQYDICISSTYKEYVTEGGMEFATEFIFTIKSVTLRTEPCGTPFSWIKGRDSVLPTWTLNILP